jgi:phage replication O-like protein O
MASPQLEHGHTRIAHDILHAVCRSNLSSVQIRAVLWLIRLTYGFHRKEVMTNPAAFAKVLRTTEKYVVETIDELEGLSVITAEWATKNTCKLSLNKDFDKWKCFL